MLLGILTCGLHEVPDGVDGVDDRVLEGTVLERLTCAADTGRGVEVRGATALAKLILDVDNVIMLEAWDTAELGTLVYDVDKDLRSAVLVAFICTVLDIRGGALFKMLAPGVDKV